MKFDGWWIGFRGFDDPVGKDAARACWSAALEEAAMVCAAVCHADISAFANGYNQGALDCEQRIREILKP